MPDPQISGDFITPSSKVNKRKSVAMPGKRSRHAMMRYGFFMATAAWGFVLGAGFLAVALGLENIQVPKNGITAGLLALGTLLALVGGLLGANAYRESRGN